MLFGGSLHRNVMQLTGAKPAHAEKAVGRINDRLCLSFVSPIWWDCVVLLGSNDESGKSGAKTPYGGTSGCTQHLETDVSGWKTQGIPLTQCNEDTA